MAVEVRAFARSDEAWLRDASSQAGGAVVVSRGVLHDVTKLPGFVALAGEERGEQRGGERLGFAQYRTQGDTCELVIIVATRRHEGVGTALIAAVEDAARIAGCCRLWLITSNDNLDAMRFYQRRGYRLAAVHRDALRESRRLKPEIPEVGSYRIEILDEVELEKLL